MAKHRKTRQEKIVADHRHITYHLEPDTAPKKATSVKKTEFVMTPSHKTQSVSYAYVTKDLRKTTFITIAIALSQIFLFIFLNRI